MGLKGLLPAAVRTQALQAQAIITNLRGMSDDLTKYTLLRDLQDSNERLFYYVLSQHTEEVMPIVYTPIVGLACQKYSMIFRRPRGIYITAHDAGRVLKVLSNWPERDVKVRSHGYDYRNLYLFRISCRGPMKCQMFVPRKVLESGVVCLCIDAIFMHSNFGDSAEEA